MGDLSCRFEALLSHPTHYINVSTAGRRCYNYTVLLCFVEHSFGPSRAYMHGILLIIMYTHNVVQVYSIRLDLICMRV